MKTELAIIILNYRTPDLTIDCLESLRGEIQPGIRVVVVDNASGDGSADRIQDRITAASWGAWAEVARSPVNGGFAAGNNFGIRAVTADAYVLLNSDTIVRPGAIAELRAGLEQHPRVGIIAPSLEDGQGSPEQSCFRSPHPAGEFLRAAVTGPITKLLRRYDVPLPYSEAPVEPEWIGFACVLIRKQVFDEVGLLDEGYFMYFEDVDFCQRVRAAGWKILYWPRPRVVHFMGGSSNISSADPTQRRAARYYYEARSRYFATYFGQAGLLAANVLWTAGRAVSFSREVIERKPRQVRKREIADIWINALRPFSRSLVAPPAPGLAASPTVLPLRLQKATSGDGDGARNSDSQVGGGAGSDISLGALLWEDFATHGHDVWSPGFWAVAVHRLGAVPRSVRPGLLRAPLSFIHDTLSTGVDWLWGIDLGDDVTVGRRLRIWHHGGIVLWPRSIGDDVHIRHNTMLGDPGPHHRRARPAIGDRVRLGVGVSILGDVTIGHDTVVGPNAVVLASCPPHSRLGGVPARGVPAAVAAAVETVVPPVTDGL